MSRRILPFFLLALALAGSLSGAATGQEIVLLAFGDSITEGYGDTSSLGGGYTTRLQRWLRQQGYDAIVENHGVGGETTSSGLSRIDSVLAGGGDYLLLMEGTNDISRRASVETIRFNLNEMAHRAEALQINVVHASVIPRIPTAPADASNSATSALALAIRTMGEEFHRAVADQFTLFEGLPNLFENYYFYDPEVEDIVGHPNTDGYVEMAGLFLETMLPLLDSPIIEILPPPSPLQVGSLAAFGIGSNSLDQFLRVEWDFGDGGFAVTAPPGDLDSFYIFLQPGTYSVSVRGHTASGAVAEDAVVVVVTGSEPQWNTDSVVLPLVVASNDGQLVTDLAMVNFGLDFAIAEAAFLPEIAYDEPAPLRRFVLPGQGTTNIPEVLADAFRLGSGRGALQITFYAYPQSSTGWLTASALVRKASDSDGSSGASVDEVSSAQWSAAAAQILALPHSPETPATLALTNLDSVEGSVRFDLLDAAGAQIGSGAVSVGGGASRLRALSDLFRGLELRPAPFRVAFEAATIRFSAAALVAGATSEEVIVKTATRP